MTNWSINQSINQTCEMFAYPMAGKKAKWNCFLNQIQLTIAQARKKSVKQRSKRFQETGRFETDHWKQCEKTKTHTTRARAARGPAE